MKRLVTALAATRETVSDVLGTLRRGEPGSLVGAHVVDPGG
jgi:hypothetical protein